MAYGVKYRLIFSDLLGHAKKVEILQDGYSGEVLPMIGTGDPVQIEWEGDDDFYEPIIGSSCTLNLLVTDDVTYDDFFKGNEEEYRVQIYYDRNQSNVFQDRVEEFATNAGRIEVHECIENELTQGNTISSDFTKRVLNDGGTIDNETCIGKSITDSRTYEWGTFWEGFLYLDTYAEALTTTPYEISITALDGLGLLDNFNSSNLSSSIIPAYPNDVRGEWYYVSEALQEFNKDATAVERYLYWGVTIQDDPTQTDAQGQNYPARMWSDYSNISDKLDYLTKKEVVQNILRKTNSRIFHAFGDWYVVPISVYLDDVFSGQYYDRTIFKDALSNGQNEIIKFQVFGVGDARDFEGNATKNVTKRLKEDLQPIENDLSIEYLSPINKVIQKTDNSSFARINNRINYGQGFTFGTSGYTLTNGTISQHEYVASNDTSFKLSTTQRVTNQTTKTLALETRELVQSGSFVGSDVSYSFNYYFDSSFTQNNNIEYELFYIVKARYGVGSLFSTQYFDKENNEMTSSIVYNSIKIEDYNKLNTWSSENKSLPNDFDFGGDQFGGRMVVEIQFYYPYIKLINGYGGLYIDNIITRVERSGGEDETLTTTNVNSTNKGFFDIDQVPNEKNVMATFDSPNDLFPIQDNSNVAQQILNDYRSFVSRYEGNGYGNKNKPVTPLDKLYMNFDNYKDDQSSMVDNLKYNIRKNTFEFIAHTPNNDPDVTTTSILKQN